MALYFRSEFWFIQGISCASTCDCLLFYIRFFVRHDYSESIKQVKNLHNAERVSAVTGILFWVLSENSGC